MIRKLGEDYISLVFACTAAAVPPQQPFRLVNERKGIIIRFLSYSLKTFRATAHPHAHEYRNLSPLSLSLSVCGCLAFGVLPVANDAEGGKRRSRPSELQGELALKPMQMKVVCGGIDPLRLRASKRRSCFYSPRLLVTEMEPSSIVVKLLEFLDFVQVFGLYAKTRCTLFFLR